MKKLFLISTCLFSFATGQCQSWQWAQAPINVGSSTGKAITIDPSGNVCVAYDAITSSPPNYMNAYMCSGAEGILAKHSASGQLIWWRGIGARIVSAVTTDKAGNIFVTGDIINSGIFCGSNASQQITLNGTPGTQETFVAKYDPSGNLMWAKLWQITNNMSTPEDIKTDASGNVYVPIYYGPNGPNGGGFFTLVKYDTQGTIVWQTPPVFRLWTKAIDVDDTGNSYMTGIFRDTVTIGSTVLTTTATANVFVAKIDNSGNVVWAKKEGTGYGEGTGISLDKNGSVYVTGWFVGHSTFGTTTLTGCNVQPAACAFILKYALSGASLWATELNVMWTHIAADSLGCYIGTGNELMVVRYNTAGAIQWTINPTAQNGYVNWMTDIVTDRKNNCYLTGSIHDNVILGSTSLNQTPQRVNFGFIAKINEGTTTAIHKQTENKNRFKIFPNPARNVITIINEEPSGNQNATIRIYNITGEQVYSKVLAGGNGIREKIDLSEFPQGIYFVETGSEGKKELTKLIVEE
jgi:hypothetical protein